MRTWKIPELKIWKIPDQVVRLGILFVVVGAALLAVRSRLVPETFGELGHYRAAAVDAIVAKEIQYAGEQTCIECHDDAWEVKRASYHRSLACEVCHGPGWAHANDFEVLPAVPRKRGEACLYCHSYLRSRPTGFPQIIERLHNPLQGCIECHDPHDPTPPHTPEACSACHAEISRTKAISHHAPLACETCHVAAPEHRENPRAHLPSKPSANDLCAGCHARGADSPSHIPRVEAAHGGRYLCWQCHYPHFPEGEP